MFRVLGAIVVAGLGLLRCAAQPVAARRDDPQPEAPPPPPRQKPDTPPIPDWARQAGQVPEVGVACSLIEENAEDKAELVVRANIIDRYCGTGTTPQGRRFSGTIFGSFTSRTARQYMMDGRTCVYVEMMWSTVMCKGAAELIRNPALPNQP